MAGKRLLDAAAILNASKAVASSHLSLRLQQLDVYSKTSSLSKLLNNQQSREVYANFTSAAQAPSTPASRPFPASRHSTTRSYSKQVPSVESTRAEDNAAAGKEALGQDHHYGRDGTKIAPNTPSGNLRVKQEQAKGPPLPDGTISFEEGVAGQSKSHIPSEVAEPPRRTEENELGGRTGSDTFYQRPNSTSASRAALPQTQIPENAEVAQGGDSHVETTATADVFYSSSNEEAESETARGSSENQEPSREMMDQLFHSPRAGKVLKGSANKQNSVYSSKESGVSDVKQREKDEAATLGGDIAKNLGSSSNVSNG